MEETASKALLQALEEKKVFTIEEVLQLPLVFKALPDNVIRKVFWYNTTASHRLILKDQYQNYLPVHAGLVPGIYGKRKGLTLVYLCRVNKDNRPQGTLEIESEKKAIYYFDNEYDCSEKNEENLIHRSNPWDDMDSREDRVPIALWVLEKLKWIYQS